MFRLVQYNLVTWNNKLHRGVNSLKANLLIWRSYCFTTAKYEYVEPFDTVTRRHVREEIDEQGTQETSKQERVFNIKNDKASIMLNILKQDLELIKFVEKFSLAHLFDMACLFYLS